jgi:hypothetical protein
MSDKKMTGFSARHPIINDPFTKANTLDFASNSANLEALYLLHDG